MGLLGFIFQVIGVYVSYLFEEWGVALPEFFLICRLKKIYDIFISIAIKVTQQNFKKLTIIFWIRSFLSNRYFDFLPSFNTFKSQL